MFSEEQESSSWNANKHLNEQYLYFYNQWDQCEKSGADIPISKTIKKLDRSIKDITKSFLK